jgi:hypothetical protein
MELPHRLTRQELRRKRHEVVAADREIILESHLPDPPVSGVRR